MEQLEPIKSKIYEIRGQRVMLDFDLAALYGVETRRLNEQVKRNIERFPEDFMFQLTKGEFEILRAQLVTSDNMISQIVTSNHAESQESDNWKSQFATSKSEAGYAAIQRRDQKQASVASDALTGGGNRRYTAI